MAYQDVKTPWEDWHVINEIGRGGFGVVYEVERSQYGIQERAAMKVITIPQSLGEIDDLLIEGYDPNSITQRFDTFAEDIVREYGMMAQMKGNANIVYCDDYRIIQQDNGFGRDIYIRMELLTPLLKAMDRVSSETQIIRFGIEMCNALEACQKRKVIHRDIKPQNIFVSDDGVFKLGDFGIARKAEKTTRATVGKGTYQFMAPEVKNEQPYGPTVDIYSLGLVMYWLLNERRSPFLPLPPTVPTYNEQQEAFWRRFSGEKIPAPKNGSEGLKRIVLKACAFDPKDRYQTAREMREDLMHLSNGQAVELIPEPQPAPIPDIQDDIDDNKTVGPVFNHPPAIDADDWDKTVGPQFLPKDKKDIPDKKKNEQEQQRATYQKTYESHTPSKKMGKILIGGICILIVLIIGCIYDNAFPRYVPIEPTSLIEQIPVDNVLIADEITFDKDSEGNYLTKPVFGSEIMRNQIKTITFLDSVKEAPETAWDVSELQNGAVMAWVESNEDLYDLYIAGDGGVRAPANCYGLFALYENMESLDFNGCFSTNQVSNMQSMFYNCKSLKALDISGFDTSCVTNMVCMFRGCEVVSELDVSGFETSNVTDMRAMFALCKVLKTIDVSGFDTAKVENMTSMFDECRLLESIDVSAFDTSQVKTMNTMFYGCTAAASINVKGLDTSRVTDMSGMFSNCHALQSLDLTSFDTSNVISTKNMFLACKSLKLLNVSGFNTTNVTDMRAMFCFCSSLTDLDVSGFKTQLVTDMGYMFRGCASLGSLDVSNFNTSNATNMKNMFRECESLVHLDVTGFDTKNVMDMSGMFYGCRSLFRWNIDKQYYESVLLNVDNWDLSKVESFEDFVYVDERGLVYFNEIPWTEFFS